MTHWSHSAFEQVARFVGVHTGLSFESTRRADAEAGIRRAMERVPIGDVSRYLELLESSGAPLDDLVTELTVGETYFFREPAHFDFIRNDVFPEVLERRGADHVLRAWSAGCASGEEPYSLAMLLEETGFHGRVLGTDISRAALQRAREAAYRPWSLRGVADGRIQRFFHQAGDRWMLSARPARSVTFEFHNLAQGVCPSLPAGIRGIDLILCRNVLIYFDRATIARVAAGLHDALADGGWLITGPSDPPLDGAAPFVPVVTTAGVFYRKRDSTRRLSIPARKVREEVPHTAPATSDMASVLARTQSWPASALGDESSSSASDPLADAYDAFAAGRYKQVLALTRDADTAPAAVLHVRALANARGSDEAERYARLAATRHPLSAELHLLHAVLLLDLRRPAEAEQALKRVLYLDRSLVIAHYLLGSTLRDQGRPHEARRAYRNARDLARMRPPHEVLPLTDGERAATVVASANAEMALIDARTGAKRMAS